MAPSKPERPISQLLGEIETKCQRLNLHASTPLSYFECRRWVDRKRGKQHDQRRLFLLQLYVKICSCRSCRTELWTQKYVEDHKLPEHWLVCSSNDVNLWNGTSECCLKKKSKTHSLSSQKEHVVNTRCCKCELFVCYNYSVKSISISCVIIMNIVEHANSCLFVFN